MKWYEMINPYNTIEMYDMINQYTRFIDTLIDSDWLRVSSGFYYGIKAAYDKQLHHKW